MEKTHFTRAPKIKDLEKVLKNGARQIFITKTAKERMSKKAIELIKKYNAELIIESARGRPISLGLQKISQIVELHKDNRTYREIENLTGISKSTCHYLIKYAERQKLKQGNNVVYL